MGCRPAVPVGRLTPMLERALPHGLHPRDSGGVFLPVYRFTPAPAMLPTSDLHVVETRPLVPPALLHRDLPLSEAGAARISLRAKS